VQTALDKAEADNARWSYAVTGSVLVLIVLLLGSVYYPMAVRTKMNETKYADEPTFNASAYLRWNHPEDAAAIAWIDANISDAGPFVEALGNDYDEYAGRVATHTGIPSVLGLDPRAGDSRRVWNPLCVFWAAGSKHVRHARTGKIPRAYERHL
jgi:uncharacterized membrane protein